MKWKFFAQIFKSRSRNITWRLYRGENTHSWEIERGNKKFVDTSYKWRIFRWILKYAKYGWVVVIAFSHVNHKAIPLCSVCYPVCESGQWCIHTRVSNSIWVYVLHVNHLWNERYRVLTLSARSNYKIILLLYHTLKNC